MKKIKRWMSMVLIVSVIFLSLPLTALAENIQSGTGTETTDSTQYSADTVDPSTDGSGSDEQKTESTAGSDVNADNADNSTETPDAVTTEGTGQTEEAAGSTTNQVADGTDQFPDYSINTSSSAYVKGTGWSTAVSSNEVIGTTGKSKPITQFQSSLNIEKKAEASSESTAPDLGIMYSTHVAYTGWMDYKSNGEAAGDAGKNYQIEGIKIKLTGADADKYDVWYCAHVSNIGWMDWAENDELAGTSGISLPIEALKIVILPKGSAAPGETATPSLTKQDFLDSTTLTYQTHVASIGWQDPVTGGSTAGTTGKNLSIEGIKISLGGEKTASGISYQAHVQNIGDQGWKNNGSTAGTTGQSLRTEAFQIKLTGAAAEVFDVYYQVHSSYYGWLGWAKNGEWAGTKGLSYKAQAVVIKLVPKGDPAPGDTSRAYVTADEVRNTAGFKYSAHVSNVGWQNYVENGSVVGIENGNKQVESFRMKIGGIAAQTSYIGLQAHVSNIGWQSWSYGTEVSTGTTGQGLPMEAVCMNLNGTLGDIMDLWYQVQVKDYGWLDWTKNGNPAGTTGGGKAITAIRCLVLPKGSSAPGNTSTPFMTIEPSPYPDCIVVNIDKQEMTLFRNGRSVISTPVVTGTRGYYDTPRGDFRLYGHTTGIYLTGPGYSSYVNYWMPFYDECGVHDATWRSSFGGNIYTYDGSHGCVNTPLGAAGIIYNNSWVGMPVVVQ
ncbi:MAG: L,D-transpeptidase family protein [Eubacteriaceae bacterium]|jgi:uncharacterized protein YjdB